MNDANTSLADHSAESPKGNAFGVKRARGERLFRFVLLTMFIALCAVWLWMGVLKEPTTPETWSNSYSTSPGGHHALTRLLKEWNFEVCLLYTSPSPRDQRGSRMPSSA